MRLRSAPLITWHPVVRFARFTAMCRKLNRISRTKGRTDCTLVFREVLQLRPLAAPFGADLGTTRNKSKAITLV